MFASTALRNRCGGNAVAADEDFSVLERGLDLNGALIEDRYQVASVLGSGGFGAVYRATDLRSFGREVVLKIPHLHLLGLEGFRKRFEREIQSLLRLEHPHIVKVLDTGSYRGVPYVVLQYLEGGSLVERFERGGGRLAREEILSWLGPVAETLDFIHRRGFVHRDLKPANILFDAEDHVFLADFGIAKAVAAMETQLTQTGTIPGSVKYMGPEALKPEAVGPAYDQYALGVVVYEALCGRVPHAASTGLQLLLQKSVAPPAPLDERPPVAPPEAVAAVMKALSTAPEDRFASCSEFAEAFALGCAAQPARAKRPGRPVRAALLGVLLLLAAGVAGLVLTRRSEEPRPAALTEQRLAEAVASTGVAAAGGNLDPAALQPLLTGSGLPGWLVLGTADWSPSDEKLRLEPGASLVTLRGYADVGYAASVLPASAESGFSLGVRLGAGGSGAGLEFARGRGVLRVGDSSKALDFLWEPGRSHQILLLAIGQQVQAYIDGRAVAELRAAGLAPSGRLGAFCRSGEVKLFWMYAQPLD
jgi:protein kinase-like protein